MPQQGQYSSDDLAPAQAQQGQFSMDDIAPAPQSKSDSLIQAGEGALKGGWGAITHPGAAVKGIYDTFRHPYDTIIKPSVEQFQKGIGQFSQGDIVGGAGSVVSGLTGTGQFGNLVDDAVKKSTPGPNFNPGGAGQDAGSAIVSTEVIPRLLGGAVKGVGGITRRQPLTNKVGQAISEGSGSEESLRDAAVQRAGEQSEAAYQDESNKLQAGSLQALKEHNAAANQLKFKANSAPSKYYRPVESEEVDAEGAPIEQPPEKIRAPIPIDNTQAVAKTAMNGISKAYGSGPIADSKLNAIARNLKSFTDEPKSVDQFGNDSGRPVLEFHKLDAMRNALGDYLNGRAIGDTPTPDPMLETFGKMSVAINKDLDSGLQEWNNGAYQKFVERNDKYIKLSNSVDAQKAQAQFKMGIDPEITYNGLAKTYLKDGDSAREFLSKTGGDRETLSKMAFKKVIEDNTQDGNFNAANAMNDLKSNEAYQEAIPSQARTQTIELFKRLNSNKSGVQGLLTGLNKPRQAVGITHYGNLYLAGVPIGLALHSPVMAGVAAAYGGLKLTGFAIDKLMRNPTTARALINGASMPIGSPAVPAMARIIVNGLRGTSGLTVEDQNNNQYNAEVNDDNKLVVHK